MTFEVNGSSGLYDNVTKDSSIRYGRNAVENHMQYLEAPFINDSDIPAPILDFSLNPESADKNINKLEKFVNDNDAYLNSLPPIEYEYRYMPNLINGQVDTKALLGAAYEEMGCKKEIPLEEFEEIYIDKDTMTAEPLDINGDDKIDIAEYGANILAADMFSKNSPELNNIDGSINAKGLNTILEYTKKANAIAAAKLYSNIYNTYKLGKSLNDFAP